MNEYDKTPLEIGLRIVRHYGLYLLIFIPPLIRGSVHPWARTLITIWTILLLLIWYAECGLPDFQILRQRPLFYPICVMSALLLVSGLFAEYPAPMLDAGIYFFTCIGVYALAADHASDRRRQRELIWILIGAACLVAFIGILKRFNAMPFGLMEYPELNYPDVFMAGPFGNHNHFAGYLEMVIPFAILQFTMRKQTVSRVLVTLYAVLLLMLAHVLSLSRGGWAALGCGLILVFVLLLRENRFSHKRLLYWGIGAFLIIVVVSLFSTPVIARLMTLTHQDVAVGMAGRIWAWQGVVDMVVANPVFGSGPGSFAILFPRFQPPGLAIRFYYAHNDYLQAVAEYGVLIIPVMLWGAYSLRGYIRRLLKSRSRQKRAMGMATSGALVAISIHSLVDFNIHIPANAILLAVVIGLACSSAWNRAGKKEEKT